MARRDKRIDQLIPSSIPLDGNDLFAIYNANGTRNETLNSITDFVKSNVTGATSSMDTYVTGVTLNVNSLELGRNQGLSTLTVDLSSLITSNDTYVTGATFDGSNVIISRNQGLSDITIDLSSLSTSENRLISGGASFFSGLTYNVTPLQYTIGGILYAISGNSQVTTISGDTNYDRIDLIIADISGNTSILNGTPSVNPVSPDVDELTQIVIAIITVPMGVVTINTDDEVVYSDNNGWPNEWATSIVDDPGFSIDLNYTGTTYGGSPKSIYYNNSPNLAAVHFDVSGGTYDTTINNYIQFRLYNTIPWGTNVRLTLRLKNQFNNQIGNIVQIFNGKYGFNSLTTGVWQTILIPLADFNPTTNIIGRIKFETYKNTGSGLTLVVDDIRLVAGQVVPQPGQHWFYINGDNTGFCVPTQYKAQLNLYGGTNINTSVDTSTIMRFHLNDNISLNSVSATTFYGDGSNLTGIPSYWTSGSTGLNSVRLKNGGTSDSTGSYSVAIGRDVLASGAESHAEGYLTTASGPVSHAEGYSTTASGTRSHAEGESTTSSGNYSHAEGSLTISSGAYSHAEGRESESSGNYSHAEGKNTVASGLTSHAEGYYTSANGAYSHAEGRDTIANGDASHAEGRDTIANGYYTHVGGYKSIANGSYSFVHGYNSMSSANNVNVFGTNITGTTANTTYVDKFNIKTLSGGASIANLGIDSNGYIVNGTSGMTDSYTTTAYLSGNTIIFDNNNQGSNLYNVNLTPILSGKYVESFAFTAATTSTITHNLGDTDVIVQIKDASGELITPDLVNNYTSNSVDIKVSATETMRVIIKA